MVKRSQAGISIISVIFAMGIVTFLVVAGSKALLNYLQVTNKVRGKDLLTQVEDSVRAVITEKMGNYFEDKHAYMEVDAGAQIDSTTGQYTTLPNCSTVVTPSAFQAINWGNPTSYFSISLVQDGNYAGLNYSPAPTFYSDAYARCAEASQKWGLFDTENRLFFCLRVDPVGPQPQRSVLENGPMLIEVSYTLWDTAVGQPTTCERFFETHTRAGAIFYRMYWNTSGPQGTTSILQSTSSNFVAKTHL